MAHSCPDCGTEFELHDRTARVRTGACGGCGLVLTYLAEGGAAPDGAVVPAATEGGEVPTAQLPALACPSCGGTLELTVGEGGDLAAACDDCDEEFTYRCIKVGDEEAAPVEAAAPRDRAPSRRFERMPRSDDRERDEGPRARPCRQCGAPLTFTTLPDGGVEGSCSSCGNRFSLPPRRDSYGGGGRERRGGYGGGPRRGGGPWTNRRGGGGPPRGGGGFNRGPGRYGRRESRDDEEGGSRRPRRRRNDDE